MPYPHMGMHHTKGQSLTISNVEILGILSCTSANCCSPSRPNRSPVLEVQRHLLLREAVGFVISPSAEMVPIAFCTCSAASSPNGCIPHVQCPCDHFDERPLQQECGKGYSLK
ncbi:unnamed protein product [Ostreobium quekettii]|uniref:Uncharacterized protein n=1 Tax=Ostreobium quekettii TaxID=121088 RepID=A0A8S1J698_9CHLO|nr:unnamed protein product [Ostreobium quekettii]